MLIGGAVALGLVLVTAALQSLPTAVPSVDYATVWPDTVERGPLVRQIRGPGTLVPEQARLITAVTNGRVEEIRLLPGSQVNPGDLILRMSNPDVDMQLLEAQTVADTAALDRYTFLRRSYLQRREYLTYDGKPPPPKDDE